MTDSHDDIDNRTPMTLDEVMFLKEMVERNIENNSDETYSAETVLLLIEYIEELESEIQDMLLNVAEETGEDE